MITFEWAERNPLFYFFCCSLVLLYIYGIPWTIVIIFTLYLLDRTFRDTEGEKIFGKPLVKKKQRQKLRPRPSVDRKIYFTPYYNTMSKNSGNSEKRPTLQSLIYKKRSSSDAEGYHRQPLAAIVKNNITLNSSPNIDLERRKPIFQSMQRSPASPSLYMSRNASPLANKIRSGLNIASPLSSKNTLFNVTGVAPLNDSLEVHGSYFINKSILHSPSTEKPATPIRYFSPSNVTFCNDVRSPISTCTTKTSAESVVEALKEKSKRKRVTPSTSDEACMKKKKSNEDELDSTLHDLLPNIARPSELLSKRKKVEEKDVTSTGVQCYISDDETIVRKKKKVESDDEASKLKYGLTQGDLNKLSVETDSVNDMKKLMDIDDTREINGTLDSEKNESSQVSFNDSVRSIASHCSFKTVSFADTTPDKKHQNSNKTEKSSLKLSALKNMESPYKKLFNSGCAAQNISPASVKKMRKHPIYFTAKINIDEVQRHREEFGDSGVSLKAFRLDQEEAMKRVNSLFDDNESDVDFKVQPASTTMPTLTTSISTGVCTNLFASSSQSSTLPSSVVISVPSLFSSLVTSPAMISLPTSSSLSFGSSATTLSLPQVISAVSTKASVVVTTSVLTGLQQLASGFSAVDTQPKSISSATFTFATLPGASSCALPSSTSIGTVVLPTPSVTSTSAGAVAPTSVNFNFRFGTGNSSTSTAVAQQPSLQFPPLQQPAVSLTPALPVTSKISFSIAIQPTNTNVTTASASFPPPAATSAGFSFGFQTQPKSCSMLPSTNLNTVAPVSVVSSLSTLPVSSSTSTVPTFNFPAIPSATVQPGIVFPTATPSTNVAAAPSAPTLLPSIFGQLPSANIFAASLSAATTQPSMFGAAPSTGTATAAAPLPSVFGAGSSAIAVTTLQSSIFSTSAPAVTSNSFAFGGTASVPSFNQAATTSAPAPAMGANVFAAPQTTNNVFGFTAATAATAASTGFSFGTSATAVSSSANIFNVSNATATQSSMFGQAPAPKPNVQAPQNMFGAPAAIATTSQSMFGAPAVSAPSTQNIFGAAASIAPSVFGSSTQNTFGSGTQSTFGSSTTTQNPFGGAMQQPSVFGDQSKTSSGFTFGATAASSAPSGGFAFGATTTSNSMFGQSSAPSNVFGGGMSATNNPGIFGAAKPAENVFAQQTKPASGFDFSASLTQGPTINFGGAAAPVVNGFAPPPPQNEIPKPTFNFGAQPVTPSFGSTPASPAFGTTPQPAFGAAQPFGTPNAGAGGGFTIGSGTSNPPPTRQTQRARRRLRR